MQNLSDFKKELEQIKNRFKDEISGIRAGRATPDLISKILIDCYGVKCPLDQTAAIGTEDARTLRVQPWDKNLILNIETGIRNSELGIQPVIDKETIRVILPELTAERKTQLTKLLHKKTEEARVNGRIQRDDFWKETQDKERKGEMEEDEKFRIKDELQKAIDKFHEEVEEISNKKEKEING